MYKIIEFSQNMEVKNRLEKLLKCQRSFFFFVCSCLFYNAITLHGSIIRLGWDMKELIVSGSSSLRKKH